MMFVIDMAVTRPDHIMEHIYFYWTNTVYSVPLGLGGHDWNTISKYIFMIDSQSFNVKNEEKWINVVFG